MSARSKVAEWLIEQAADPIKEIEIAALLLAGVNADTDTLIDVWRERYKQDNLRAARTYIRGRVEDMSNNDPDGMKEAIAIGDKAAAFIEKCFITKEVEA